MALLMLVLPGFWLWKLSRREWLQTLGACAILIATVFLSLSRSFWLAGIVGALVCVALVLFRARIPARTFFAGVGRGVFAKLAAALLLLIVLFFPYPHYRSGTFGGFASLFSSRTTDTADAAIDSRWKLLGPMREMISRAPILGYGFGQKVTFTTDDPRIRAQRPDGHYETFSLEWGWLELWLKMGLLGPLAFLFLFFRLAKGFFRETDGPQRWLAVGFLSALAMLAATHVFSPYLNHPIGLGFLLFAVAFLPETKPSPGKGTKVPVETVLEKPRVQANVAPAMSE
jgi:O-antigen ligase